jgi:hypothetical protein
MIVSHSEYVTDVSGSTSGFSVEKSIAINPGLAVSFPWLSQIATRFESYRFKRLQYKFITEQSTASTGFLALVPDYDPTDPEPASKAQAFQYVNVVKSAPWQNLTQTSSLQDLVKRKTYLVRDSPISGSQTLGLCDTGNMFICAGGQTDSSVLGEIWCDYEVELMTPQILPISEPPSGDIKSASLQGTTGINVELPFGDDPTLIDEPSVFDYDSPTGDITFTSDFDGLLILSLTGTVITDVNLNASNGATESVLDYALDGSKIVIFFRVTSTIGGEISFGVTATTITESFMRLASYSLVELDRRRTLNSLDRKIKIKINKNIKH